MTAVRLAEGARTLWEEEWFLDYTIEVEDKEFKVHKLVMASVSDFFKAMLTGGMKESQMDRVRLEEVDPLTVQSLIEFIYTGTLSCTTVSTEQLLSCAVYLQVPTAIEECTALLLTNININNCFDVYATFQAYSVQDGIEQVSTFIQSNIDSIMKDGMSTEMSYDGLLNLIDYWKKSEWDLFNHIKLWIHFDYDNRKQYLDSLMAHIRFALMSPKELKALRKTDTHCHSGGSWRHLVDKAREYHEMPNHLKVLDESDQSRVRVDMSPMTLVYYFDTPAMVVSLCNRQSWKMCPMDGIPNLISGLCAAIVVNNFLVVGKKSNKWYLWDPRTMQWSRISSMTVPKHNFPLVHFGASLYALGGLKQEAEDYGDVESDVSDLVTDSIQRYDFETNTWCVTTTKLPVPLGYHSAAVINGCIYVTGGWTTTSDMYSTRLDCFDLASETWHRKAPMTMIPHYRYKSFEVLEVDGEEVLFILDEHLKMLYYKPSSDQWTMWKCAEAVDTDLERIQHPELHIVPQGNKLFLFDILHGYMDENGDELSLDSQYLDTEGVCVCWTLGAEKSIKEVRLNDFPLEYEFYNQQLAFSMLMAIPPQNLVSE